MSRSRKKESKFKVSTNIGKFFTDLWNCNVGKQPFNSLTMVNVDLDSFPQDESFYFSHCFLASISKQKSEKDKIKFNKHRQYLLMHNIQRVGVRNNVRELLKFILLAVILPLLYYYVIKILLPRLLSHGQLKLIYMLFHWRLSLGIWKPLIYSRNRFC